MVSNKSHEVVKSVSFVVSLILITSFIVIASNKAYANEHFNIGISPTFSSENEALRLNATFQNHPDQNLFPAYQYVIMLNKNSTLCPLNNCYVYFQDLELRKNPLSESKFPSFNLEGNLKIGNDTPKGFLTKIYHLFGSLEIRESLADNAGNTVLYMEGEVGLSEGSEFEFVPDVKYDISTKGTKLSFPNNLPVLELKANKMGFLEDLFR